MKGRSRKRTGIWFTLVALCLLSVFPLVTRAQANYYSFTALSETYTPITGGTVLNAGIPDSWQSGQVTLTPGFTFSGVTYTYAYITSNGLISLGGTAGPGTTQYNGIANNGAGSGIHLCPFNADLNGAGTGTSPEIRFETVGNEHVFQWQDARRFNINNERISIQVRLNTTTGEIKFVYGGTINAGAGTSYQPVIGIRTSATAYKNLSIGTDVETWAAPLPGTATGNTCRFTSDAPAKFPTAGQVYLFTPPPPCSGTPVAGTPAPLVQNLCNGATPAAIVATGYTTGFSGLTFQWEESNDDGATDAWANAVGGTGATTDSYTPPAFSGTPIYYRLKVTCANGGAFATTASSLVSGPVSPTTAASAITFTNVNPSSMTIGWTSGNGTRRFVVINTTNTFTDPVNGSTGPGTANAVYAGSGQQVVYDGPGTSVDVSGLSCNSPYYARVYEYNRCGTSPSFTYYYNTATSGTNPLSQATPDLPVAVSLPVNNNFAGFTGANLATVFPGWREAAIVTAASTAPGQTNPSGTTSLWTSSTVLSGTTAKINLYTNTRNEWIISPKINITAPFTLEFKAAITNYDDGTADPSGMQGTDDKVNVLISTDPCGAGWTNIHTFQASNTTTLTNSLRQFTFYLGAPYIGQTVQIAFQATDGPTDNTPDYDFHIGDVKITQTPPCILPTGLTVSNVSTASATLTWVAPAAGNSPVNYLWKVVAAGAGANAAAVASGSVASPALSTPVTGLSSNTSYDAYVRTDCGAGDTSVWSTVASFTTTCTATNVPYTQDFESVTVPALPVCTFNQNVGTGNNWVTSSPAGNGFTSKTLTYIFNGTNPANVWFYVQGLNLTANVSYRLTYRYGNNGGGTYVEKLKVAYGTSPSATDMTNPLADHPNITNNTASISNTVDFTPTASGVYYIGFQCYSAIDRNRLFVDDIHVELTPTCYPPTAPVVSNIGTNAADVAWTAPTQGTPANYIWKVVAAGAGVNAPAVATGSVAAPALTANMTGLAPGINYDVYLRSECGGGDTSAWSTSASFLTQCLAFNTFPFTETFETNSPSRNCWSQIQVAGTANWTYAAGSNSGAISAAQQGSLNARFVAVTGTNTPITKLVSPVFDLTGITNPRVTFYLGQEVRTGNQNTTKLYYRISPTDPWVEIGNYTASIAAWTLFEVTLPNPSATYQIAFEGINNNARANVVDNVVVERTPTCYPPTGLTVTNIGSSTADLAWTAPALGTPVNYIWKAVASGAGANATALATGTVAAPALSTTMTGLPVSTTFDVYMRSECGGGDSSIWTARTVVTTTQIPVSTYPYDQGFESGFDSWQANNGSQPNKWVVDTATANGGTRALYISNDNGVSNAYTIGTSSVTHVFRDFQIPAGFPLITLNFDWKAVGETVSADRMRVYVAPVSFTPTPGTQITASGTAPTGIVRIGTEFNNQSTYITANHTLSTAYENQSFRLIFEWRNDGSLGTQPPAALDNIHVELSSCAPPSALTATPTYNTASLGWTQPGASTSWDVEYGPAGFTQGTGTMIADTLANPLEISGLSPLTSYSYYVRANCGGPESPWAGPFTFTTLCQPADLLSTTPASRCGEGTVTLAATTTPGARINWYASETALTPLDTGNTYTTPVISSSTTYYVATSAGAPPLHVGPANNMGTLNYTSLTDWGITFDVTQPTTIRSIAVYPQAAGSFTVSVKSGTGTGATVFGTYTATITAAQAGTKVIVPINVTIPTPGTGYKMLLDDYTGLGSGLHRDNPIPGGFSFPFTASGSPITLTSSEWGGTTTASYYFFYDWEIDASCYGERTPVTATVTAPPAITPTVSDSEICAGETVNLDVTSPNTGYTYTWTPGNLSGAAQSVTPATTTRYRVRAVDNSGGANDGCVTSDSSVTVTVIPLPPSPGVTPATANVCLGSSQTLSASAVGVPTPIFSENFEGASHAFTAVNTSTGTNPANAAWTVRNDGYLYAGTTNITFHSPDNSKFILSNSDAIGSGASTNTILTSPVINTTGYTGLSLKFDHTTKIFGATPHSKVEVSTNGGSTWTTVADYTTELGTSTGFVPQTINLDTYVNNANFRFRFAYTAAWSWYWAIDNVVLSGSQPLSTSWAATPSAGAGLPAGAETPDTSNGTISVTPTAVGSYVYTAITQTPQGCVSQPSSSVVTVNPLPTVDAGPTQTVCPRVSITLSGSGANTYTWDNGVSNGVAFPAPVTTTLYTVTGTDANNCSNTDTVSVIAKPETPVTISADGPLTFCANVTRTLTANGGGTGPYTYVWTPGGATTQTIQPTVTGTYTVTITEAGVCSGEASSSVTVNPVVTTVLDRSICSNQTYTLVDGTVVSTAGTYTKTTSASTGCDSIVTVNLTVNPTLTSNISVNLCQGASYTLVDGTVVNSAGTYTATTNNSSTGCDSTVTAVVTVRPVYNTPVAASICQGENYTLANGTQVNTAGVHTVTVPSVNGCDSTVAVTLTVIPPSTRTAAASICSGNSYTLPDGNQATTAGVYTSTLTSAVTGCDSIIVTTLTVNPSPNLNLGADIVAVNPPVLLNAGGGFTSYLWNTGATGQSITVNSAGTYSVTVKNQFNCTASDTVKVTFTASIVNLGDNGGSISLFPNPSSERFTLNVYGYTGGGKMVFDVINSVGQVVKTEAIGNATETFSKEMEISTLATGTYTLRVRGTNATANLRFVIAR